MVSDLNPEQLAAVLHDKGPLLIVAGAGTGKTKVITSRITYLIKELGVDPSKIAALTFTEKAATEMIERVEDAMPLGFDEVTIKTFHGFCERILRERGHEIGLDLSFKVLEGFEHSLLIKRNLFRFALEYYRPLNNPFKFVGDLLGFFSKLKDEDIQPAAYIEYANNLASRIENEVDKEVAEKNFELATFYEAYQSFMQKRGFLDFSDLIYYVLRLFESRPSVLAEYQERFSYLMVDEFQDTNFAQSKLIYMLAARSRNLAVVGDDDQSIYKWRGASLANIMQFESNFPDAKKVVLLQNYRSTKSILDLAHGVVVNNNPERLEFSEKISKKLISNRDNDSKVEILHCGNFGTEAFEVVERIVGLVRDCGAKLSDFAILARNNSHLDVFAKELKSRGIPYDSRGVKGFFNEPVVKDLVAFVSFLADPFDDRALIRLLTFSSFNIDFEQVLALCYEAKRKQLPIWKYLNLDSSQASLPLSEFQSIAKVHLILKEILAFKSRNNIGVAISKFLTDSGFYHDISVSEDFERNQRALEYVTAFSKIVADYEASQDPDDTLRFVDYLSLLNDNLRLELSDNFDENSVKLLTVHSAKGLEFDYVFVVNLVQGRFPSANKKEAFVIPDALLKEKLPSSSEAHLREERRLFYVASTRARNKLFLTYSDKYEGKKKWKPSVFISEALDSGHSLTVEIGGGEMDVATNEAVSMDFPAIKRAPIGKSVSYSQITTFKRCPQQYRFRHILKLPSISSHAANFGSSLHNALRDFYAHLQQGDEPSWDLLKNSYLKRWISTGYESIAHHNARKEMGLKIMRKYYEQNSPFVIPSFLEKSFFLPLGSIVLNGRIDRIDKLADGSFEVIDYKTGSYMKGVDLDKDLQLSIYALAAKKVLNIDVSKLSLYYLEDGIALSTTRLPADLEKCEVDLMESIELIRGSDFAPIPGYHCGFCDFRLVCSAAK